MSVEGIVEALLKEDYIEELFEGDIEAAKSEIFLVASDTQLGFEYINSYFKTLHNRSVNT